MLNYSTKYSMNVFIITCTYNKELYQKCKTAIKHFQFDTFVPKKLHMNNPEIHAKQASIVSLNLTESNLGKQPATVYSTRDYP